MTLSQWQPGCDGAAIQARAHMLKAARAFFDARGYLEVQTPSLSRHTASDPFLDSYCLPSTSGPRYLQTSPEFHMKRLLCAAPMPIYQICPAFRFGETGQRHNSEFTMIEWYAPGTSAADMAELTCLLVNELHEPGSVHRTSFRSLIRETQGVDISECDEDELIAAAQRIAAQADQFNALDYLYEKALSSLSGRVLVDGFPEALASLAALGEDGLADRFEFILEGVEIANGCQELADADEFKRRSERDNHIRSAKGLPRVEHDPRLEAALRSEIPPVSGVALGLDRLLMAKLGKSTIAEVLAFPDQIA